MIGKSLCQNDIICLDNTNKPRFILLEACEQTKRDQNIFVLLTSKAENRMTCFVFIIWHCQPSLLAQYIYCDAFLPNPLRFFAKNKN